MRYVIFVLILVLVPGCQSSRTHRAGSDGPAYVRVHNHTSTNMLRVLFQGNCFGVVQSGAFSEYQIAQFSSWDISVAFPGQTNRMEYVYVDYPGRFVYGKGWFTYDLRLHDNGAGPGQHLDVDVQQDE